MSDSGMLMNVLFILPVPSQARYWKRFHGLCRDGCRVRALAFERPYYPPPADEAFESLGSMQHGAYLRRALVLARAMFRVSSALKPVDGVHAFGLDMLVLARLAAALSVARKPTIVYELGDISPAMLGKSLRARVLRRIERWALGQVSVVVVTSPSYISEYFDRVHPRCQARYMVIENKLDPRRTPAPLARAEPHPRVRRIGYFGVLRCPASWAALRTLADSVKHQVDVIARGIVFQPPDLEAQARRHGIEYGGPYESPTDLAQMYADIDLSWIAHAFGGTNDGWIRTNRFYEACFYGVPMVAQEGTLDGYAVENYDLGVVVNLRDPQAVANRVAAITDAELDRWKANLNKLPASVYAYTSEHAELCKWLRRP